MIVIAFACGGTEAGPGGIKQVRHNDETQAVGGGGALLNSPITDGISRSKQLWIM